MADAKIYNSVAGLIQFDPAEKDVNGKPVREVSVRSIASQNLVRVTIWDQYKDVPLKKGDLLFADGQVTQNVGTKQDGTPVTYTNMSANTIVVVPGPAKVETDRTVVTQVPTNLI